MDGSFLIGATATTSDERFHATNPATGERLAPDFSAAGPDHVEAACALADAAFDTFRETTPEARATQILFGHPEYWDALSMDEHALLHGLPAPHGPLVAWLERDQAEHGVRPWAVLVHALRDDPALDEDMRAAADGDALPDATMNDFRRAVDQLLDRRLKAQAQALIQQAASDPDALARYREVFRHWEEVKARLSALPAEGDPEV